MAYEDEPMSDPAALPAPPPGGWTYADYAALPDDGRRYEVLEGELVEMPSPRYAHQRVLGHVYRRVADHVESQGLGDVVLAPMDVVLAERTVLQPDLLFIAHERLAIHDDANVKGAPDLCVEILSPSNAAQDRLRKAALYARFGVAHLWIVDIEARSIEEYVLDGEAYRARSVTSFDAEFRPALFPGLAIRLGERLAP